MSNGDGKPLFLALHEALIEARKRLQETGMRYKEKDVTIRGLVYHVIFYLVECVIKHMLCF